MTTPETPPQTNEGWQGIESAKSSIKRNGLRDPSDAEILAAVGRWGNRSMTYVVRNVLFSAGFRRETPWVRRQLMRLEREGRVVRASTSYATQICWSVTTPTPEPRA